MVLGSFKLLFFSQKDFTHKKKAQKSTKSIKSTKKAHKQAKTKKRQHFYVLKKYLKEKKLFIRLFLFLCFLWFLYVKQKRQHFHVHKKHLREKKLLIHLFVYLCFLCFFVLFCAFFVRVKTKKTAFLCA